MPKEDDLTGTGKQPHMIIFAQENNNTGRQAPKSVVDLTGRQQ